MRPKASLFILALLVLLGAGGCEDSARRRIQVRPPEVFPPTPMGFEGLPLDHRHAQFPLLRQVPPDGLEILIKWVEAAFRTSEQNYKAGRASEARRDLDRALRAILASRFDLQADPRLNRLFDRIVETIHIRELAAAQQTEAFTEQSGEPAPIDEIAETNLPPDPSLKARAEFALRQLPHDLPLTVNDYVLSYLNFFQTPRGRAIAETGLRRAGRFRDMISRVLREEGLPQDLIYLAQAESAFQPAAVSRAGARGIWQFMAYRAREYGLQRSWWVDERQDPEKATRAAARHLRDLYEMFGDWYLVMAAYNSGPANVARAIERTGYADFWELYKRNVLPRETRNYVPIILALTLIAKDAARYGIAVDPDPPLEADRVKPGRPVALRLIAESLDADLETLKALNPELLRMVTPDDPNFELRLPPATGERFVAALADIPPEKWTSWRRYRVAEGETLAALAKRFRVTSRAILDVNGLAADAPLPVGEKLIIPAAARPEYARGKLVRYRVRRGDTLESIADYFDVTPVELKRWNGLRSNRVRNGMRLKVYPGGRLPPPSPTRARVKRTIPSQAQAERAETRPATPGEPVVHRVQRGETLWSIARAYRTTVESLRATNRFLFHRRLQVGDILKILPAQ